MRLINTHSINVSKPFILAGLITCGFLTPLPAMAETDTPTYSGGLSLGIFGLGLNLSKKTEIYKSKEVEEEFAYYLEREKVNFV